jgi:hypothetical protein
MRTLRLALPFALAAGLAQPLPVRASVDLVELAFGVSNVNGAIGNGGLTLGISHLGETSVLTWPSPSYTDHLLHVGSNAPDVHDQRNLMAHPAMGAAIALRVTTDTTSVTWLRDAAWTVTQRYPDPLAPRVETTFTHTSLGLTVVQTDLVRPDADVWVRHLAVTRTSTSPVTAVTVLAYHNLSPTLSRVPQLPLADWAMDAYNDFAAIWDNSTQTITHFRPAGRGDLTGLLDLIVRPAIDYGPIGLALATSSPSASAASLSGSLDNDYGPGAYLVLAADRPIDAFQVGYDDTPICDIADVLVDNVQTLPDRLPGLTLPLDPQIADALRCDRTPASIAAENGWSDLPSSAFDNVIVGQLDNNPIAAGQVDTALSVPLTFEGNAAEVTFTLSAAATATDARALSATHTPTPFTDHLATLNSHWHNILGKAHLPSRVSPRLLEVCQRALMNLLVAMDKNTGAIVASIARQAPYGLDWPRDGAFFNVALDVAGFPDLAAKHARFTMRAQRASAVAPEPLINTTPPTDPDDPGAATYPADAWEMNYYADGLVGGNIRWEIDNAGLAVWGLTDHARYLDATAAAAWQAEIWPTVERAANLLARWRDPANGLHAPAYEDDNHHPTQTLHGAITTWLALHRSAELADDLGNTTEATRWRARADELGAAIETHLVDQQTGLFIEGLDEAVNPGNAAGGASAWALWPAGFLAHTDHDERTTAIADWLMGLAAERLTLTHGGGAYIPKILVAVAMTDRRPATRTRVLELLETLARDTATPDTAIFGEVFAAVDDDDDGTPDRFSARVSKPHVWAGVLTYLSAMAATETARFDSPLETTIVKGRDGCHGGHTEGLGLVATIALLLVYRRSLSRSSR